MKTDKQLQLDVLEELKYDPSADAAKISVTVQDGMVSLLGSVSCNRDKMAAERITKRVSGVRSVTNSIKVQLPTKTEAHQS